MGLTMSCLRWLDTRSDPTQTFSAYGSHQQSADATMLAAAMPIAALAVTAAAPVRVGRVERHGVQIPPNLANFHEPGSTGYVPKTTQVAIPSWLKNFHEPGSTGFVPTPAVMTVTSAAGGGGLDWVSALIGAGAGLGAALAGAGAYMTVRKRRALAHV